MALEAATFINDFVATNPVAGDNVSQGDDHLRLLKAVLKSTLPNLTRAYYLEQDRVDLASATTPDLSTPASSYINITGTTQIDGFATEPAGFLRRLRFAGALTLNYNATSLILITGDDILTAAGDYAEFVSLGSGNWQMLSYQRANGRALTALGAGFSTQTDIASAATVNLGTATTNNVQITGTTTITSFGTAASLEKPVYLVKFGGAILVTHNATDLVIPGGANYQTAAGDTMLLEMVSSGSWRVRAIWPRTPASPTVQRFTSGSGNYIPPANLKYVKGKMVAGGGGGGALGTNNGVAGTASSFGTWTANPGAGGLTAGGAGGAGGTGGTNGTGTLIDRIDGQNGASGDTNGGISGGGGSTPYSGGAPARFLFNSAGAAAKANTGSGGSGGNGAEAGAAASAGGAGEYVEFYMTAAQIGASLAYVVGPGGAGGAAGTQAGGAGAAGKITVEEFYN